MLAQRQGDIFGCRVYRLKVGLVIEMAVMPADHDPIDPSFQTMKIHDNTNVIELRRLNCYTNTPVVSVQRFERTIVKLKLVRCGKRSGDGDLKRHNRMD